MKINWGTGIVIAFVLFISFIMYFVFRMTTQEKSDHQLVTEKYYQKELEYQSEIEAEKNIQKYGEDFVLKQTDKGVLITFPRTMVAENIKGNVFLYRPSNENLDFDIPIRLSSSHLLIPDDLMLGGRWDIRVSWEYEGKPHLYKKSITYKK
jgi:hypothetical protein